jgi:hypothetical protein
MQRRSLHDAESQHPEREIPAPKSRVVQAVLWVGSLFWTGWAIYALGKLTPIPAVLVFFGGLVLVTAWTSPDGTTYEVLPEAGQKVVSWLFILGGSCYVLIDNPAIWAVVATAVYWVVLCVRFAVSKRA